MSKRKSDVADLTNGSSKARDVGQNTARPDASASDDEMGEFEDRWEDEIESEEEVVADGEGEEDGDGKLICDSSSLPS